jgi:hypothetical protein
MEVANHDVNIKLCGECGLSLSLGHGAHSLRRTHTFTEVVPMKPSGFTRPPAGTGVYLPSRTELCSVEADAPAVIAGREHTQHRVVLLASDRANSPAQLGRNGTRGRSTQDRQGFSSETAIRGEQICYSGSSGSVLWRSAWRTLLCPPIFAGKKSKLYEHTHLKSLRQDRVSDN